MSHRFHEPRALRSGLALVCFFLSFATLALTFCGVAHAEDVKTINRVTDLNRKALEAYAASDFNRARQILKQALDVCNATGLDRHPIAARTHIHMGVVMMGGLNQRDLAIKQFQRALEIQPDIQVTRNVASPDVLAAFREASSTTEASGGGDGEGAGASPGGAGDEGGEGGEGTGGGRAPARAAPSNGVIHTPVTRAKVGQPVLVTARLGANVSSAEKLVLFWKGANDDDFTSKDMTRSGNKYAAQIPGSAAKGRAVSYYIEAQDSEGTVLASAGGEAKPIAVVLGAGKKCPEGDEDCADEGGTDVAEGPPLFFALMGGWGAGYTTGSADRTSALKVSSGFAPASIAHVAPEVGYFLKPDMRLSLQGRIQFVGGPNRLLDSNGKVQPAAGVGVAVLARMAWFFGEGALHPYASVALGGGQIRHVVVFGKGAKMCGTSGNASCIDTVTAGPIFAGGGGGMTYDLTSHLALVAELNALAGFTKFTFHFDVNGGLALRI
jgi:hypothetical protein